MPTFIDRHSLTAIPRATRNQLHVEATHALTDVSGARPLGHWIEDGVIYCILEAPDEEAVCRHHQARSLSCDDVHRLPGLRELRPTSREDQAVVRAAIHALWHANPPPGAPVL